MHAINVLFSEADNMSTPATCVLGRYNALDTNSKWNIVYIFISNSGDMKILT